MMRKVLSMALLLMVLGPALGQEVEPPDITGTWSSSTGAVIEIPAFSKQGKNFSLIVYKELDGPEVFRTRAHWQAEEPNSFVYSTPGGEMITGVLRADGEEIKLCNENKTWTSRWIPGTRH